MPVELNDFKTVDQAMPTNKYTLVDVCRGI